MNRTEWGKTFCFCMWPGCNWQSFQGESLQTHEMIGGPMRWKSLMEPASWLRLCPFHHEGFPSMPKEELLTRLLAIKQHYDPEHYELETVLKLWRPHRGRWDDGPIVQSEVDETEKRLFGG